MVGEAPYRTEGGDVRRPRHCWCISQMGALISAVIGVCNSHRDEMTSSCV